MKIRWKLQTLQYQSLKLSVVISIHTNAISEHRMFIYLLSYNMSVTAFDPHQVENVSTQTQNYAVEEASPSQSAW